MLKKFFQKNDTVCFKKSEKIFIIKNSFKILYLFRPKFVLRNSNEIKKPFQITSCIFSMRICKKNNPNRHKKNQ